MKTIQTYFLNYSEFHDRVTRQATSDRQQDVCWLQVCTWHDHPHITGSPLLVHGFTVKLSPCQCSHSSPAGQIATCLYGHSKCYSVPRLDFLVRCSCHASDILNGVIESLYLDPNSPSLVTLVASSLPDPSSPAWNVAAFNSNS